jgi:predicted ArsR family transcriptional regulator
MTLRPTPPATPPPATSSVRRVAALADELRWSLYAFIRRVRRPVTRDEAALSAGISRKLAAHHLDKLVAVGLLRASYEPVDGVRRVGRTPKVYEPTDLHLHVSIPTRHHDLLAEILIQAIVTQRVDETSAKAAERVAQERGHEVGTAERKSVRAGRLGAERALTLAANALAQQGFEPERVPRPLGTEQVGSECIRLRNCPFHPLAATAPDLVCAVNHSYIQGLVAGLRTTAVTAELRPVPGECCVQIYSGARRGG